MKPKPDRQRKELLAKLLSLAEACPLHQANPRDCPLYQLRKMEPKERVEWCNVLDDADLLYVATYHKVCLATRTRLERLKAPVRRAWPSRR
jgi:hypothetical protein